MPSDLPTPVPAPLSADLSEKFNIDSCSILRGPVRAGGCRVLMVLAHPATSSSRVHRRLVDAAAQIDGVWVNDLYETYPDFYIDVARERKLIASAHTLLLVYPTQWYSCPALLKEWLDVVLGDAWQRDRFSTRGLPGNPAALRCWIVTSTGGAAADFAPGRRHGRPFADYLAPFEQMARVCAMEWLEPLVLHGAHEVDSAAVDAHVTRFTADLQALAGIPYVQNEGATNVVNDASAASAPSLTGGALHGI